MVEGCIKYGAPCPEDFITCSSECNLAHRADEAVSNQDGFDIPPEGKKLYTIKETAEMFGKSQITIYAWRQNGKIPRTAYYRLAGRKTLYDIEAIVAAGIVPAQKDPTKYDPLLHGVSSLPSLQLPSFETPRQLPTIQTQMYRERGLKAAKEAFREVILECADEAKARGDFAQQAKMLEDFIFFEDGLTLMYNGRMLQT